jgi:FMN phosphatase YigB (HAD superfamily)
VDRPRVSLLITDLDNTVYDWLSAFVPAFYAMVEIAAPLIGIEVDHLLDELQVVHRSHSDSEHPFALLETRSVQRNFRGRSEEELLSYLDPAFHAFNKVRKEHLKLYDGVYDTLEELFSKRVPIVAYTDARVINCLFRLERLGVKQFFSRLYAPAHVRRELDSDVLTDGFVRLLAAADKKPNPQTLLDICAEFGAAPGATVYVGDSLVRDIYMANAAGVHSAWAKFGTMYDKALWPKLVRVTHWTDADVEREKVLRDEAGTVVPECVMERFSDLNAHFDFEGAPA